MKAAWALGLLGWSATASAQQDISRRSLDCDDVWFAAEHLPASRLAEVLEGPVPLAPDLLSCLESAQVPSQLLDALRRREAAAQDRGNTPWLVLGDVATDPDAPERLGRAIAGIVRGQAGGDRPWVVLTQSWSEPSAWWFL